VDQGSGGHGLMQAASGGGSGRRRGRCGGAGRRLAGTMEKMCRGAPIATGTAPGRRQAAREHSSVFQGRRRQHGTADDGETRRWSSDDLDSATPGMKKRTKDTCGFLTVRRSCWRLRRRWTGGGQAEPKRWPALGLQVWGAQELRGG
jgi:hypothetical protein